MDSSRGVITFILCVLEKEKNAKESPSKARMAEKEVKEDTSRSRKRTSSIKSRKPRDGDVDSAAGPEVASLKTNRRSKKSPVASKRKRSQFEKKESERETDCVVSANSEKKTTDDGVDSAERLEGSTKSEGKCDVETTQKDEEEEEEGKEEEKMNEELNGTDRESREDADKSESGTGTPEPSVDESREDVNEDEETIEKSPQHDVDDPDQDVDMKNGTADDSLQGGAVDSKTRTDGLAESECTGNEQAVNCDTNSGCEDSRTSPSEPDADNPVGSNCFSFVFAP